MTSGGEGWIILMTFPNDFTQKCPGSTEPDRCPRSGKLEQLIAVHDFLPFPPSISALLLVTTLSSPVNAHPLK